VLVIGARASFRCLSVKTAERKVVQRLDGFNWIHTVRPISLKHSSAPNMESFAGIDPPFFGGPDCLSIAFSQNW